MQIEKVAASTSILDDGDAHRAAVTRWGRNAHVGEVVDEARTEGAT